MLISALLILCLHLVDFGKGSFLNPREWQWDSSCKNHPFAAKEGTLRTDSASQIHYCNLTFEYPKTLSEGESEMNFCRLMYPYRADKAVKDISKDQITCTYGRSIKCKAANSLEIGTQCVSILNTAQTFGDAEEECKKQDGARLLSTEDKNIIHFLLRLYKWNRPEMATWALDTKSNAAHITLGYSAIGNKLPGHYESVPAEEYNRTATVVCVGSSENIPGAPIPYCSMLRSFLKIHSEEDMTTGTCYWATQSVVTALPNQQDRSILEQTNRTLSNVEHTTKYCKVKPNSFSYVVAPTSIQAKAALNKLLARRKQSGFLLPGALHYYWGTQRAELRTQSYGERDVANFRYTVAYKYERAFNRSTSPFVKKFIREPVVKDFTWERNYPDKREVTQTKGLLYWNKNGKIENVELSRRAPVLCATGRSIPYTKYCPDGWQVAHREGESICFLAVGMDCPSMDDKDEDGKHQEGAITTCKKYNAVMAPMESPEEASAIGRTIAKLHEAGGHWLGYTHRVLLGGRFLSEKDGSSGGEKYRWYYDRQPIGSKHHLWLPREPSYYKQWCSYKLGWTGVRKNECWNEKCVSVKFIGGKPAGLLDMYCENGCRDNMELDNKKMDTIVCAKKAAPVDKHQ